jgi:hypothetical protein
MHKKTNYIVTSHAIAGLAQEWFILFCYSVCVCLFETKIKVVFWNIFSDTDYVMVVVFIKDNSFINIIFQRLQKKRIMYF